MREFKDNDHGVDDEEGMMEFKMRLCSRDGKNYERERESKKE